MKSNSFTAFKFFTQIHLKLTVTTKLFSPQISRDKIFFTFYKQYLAHAHSLYDDPLFVRRHKILKILNDDILVQGLSDTLYYTMC